MTCLFTKVIKFARSPAWEQHYPMPLGRLKLAIMLGCLSLSETTFLNTSIIQNSFKTVDCMIHLDSKYPKMSLIQTPETGMETTPIKMRKRKMKTITAMRMITRFQILRTILLAIHPTPIIPPIQLPFIKIITTLFCPPNFHKSLIRTSMMSLMIPPHLPAPYQASLRLPNQRIWILRIHPPMV